MLSKFINFNSKSLVITISVIIISIFPILIVGMTQGHDSNLHILWSHYFSQQLFSGDMYPRWLVEMNSGFGSPVFYFYPPVTYYINSIIALFIDSSVHAQYVVALSVFLSLVVGAYGMYLWSANHVEKLHAVIASIAYTVLPYHILINVYYRGALGELWGFAVVPYLFFAASRITLKSKKQFVFISVIAISGILVTHAPTALISIPFYCLYTGYLIFWKDKVNWVSNFILLGFVLIIAFSLSAFYVYPALTIDMPSMDIMWERYSYGNAFLYTKTFIGGWRPFLYGGSLITAAFGLFLFAIYFIKKNTDYSEGLILSILFVIVILMTTVISKPIWDNIALIQKIQFPWRFNVLVTLFAAYAVGLGLSSSSLLPAFRKYNILIYIFLVCCLVLNVTYGVHSLKRSYSDVKYKKLFSARMDASEYQLSKNLYKLPHMEKISSDGAVASIKEWSADVIHFTGDFKENTRITLKYLYFGRWVVIIDGTKYEDVSVYKNSNGLMEFTIKNQASDIALYREENKQVTIGFYISMFGAFLFALMLMTVHKKTSSS